MNGERTKVSRAMVHGTATKTTGETPFSDRQYREVVEASQTMVWACDNDGCFSYLNPAWELTVGYKIEEMLGRRFTEFQRPEVAARDIQEFSSHLKGGEVTRYETSYIAKDGSEIHLIFNAKPRLDAEGRIIGTHGTAFGMNEQKALEQQVGLMADKFERFFTLIPGLACIASTDGFFKRLNPHWERTLGYTLDDLLGSPIVEFIHPEDLPGTLAETAKQVEGLPSTNFVNRFRHKDGSYRHLQWEATPANGEMLYAVARDITERIKLEAVFRVKERSDKIVLNLSQTSVRSLQELLDLALEEAIAFSYSKLGHILQYSDKSQTLTLRACSPKALPESFGLKLNAEYDLFDAGLWGEAVHQSGPVVFNKINSGSWPCNRSLAGDVGLNRFLSIPLFSNGRIVAVVGVANKDCDYTEDDIAQLTLLMERVWRVIIRKKTEIDLQDSHERLRQLSIHTESVREEERLKISREVHDELGQMMTALKFDIACIKETPSLPPELSRKLEIVDANVSEAIRSVQTISAQLRPKLLDDLGLVAAIEWHANDFTKRTGIASRLRLSAALPPLTPACTIVIFRIYQEALTNIQRHSAAGEVLVELWRREQEIVLIITDNGKGIKDGEMFAENSFGIMGMHERASSCSGKLLITGNPKEGTTVRLHIPLHPHVNGQNEQSLSGIPHL